jgi:hypothetical protein
MVLFIWPWVAQYHKSDFILHIIYQISYINTEEKQNDIFLYHISDFISDFIYQISYIWFHISDFIYQISYIGTEEKQNDVLLDYGSFDF